MTSQQGDSEKQEERSTGTFRSELMLRGSPFPIKEDSGPFANFYLDKVASAMREKHPETSFELEKNSENLVTAVIWRNITENQKKELDDALDWALRKEDENRKAEIG
jgi:hypothetical protein